MQSDSYPPLVFSKIKIHNHFCKLACSERFPRLRDLALHRYSLQDRMVQMSKFNLGQEATGIPIKSEILTNFRLDTSSNETYLECKMRNLTPSLDRDVKLALFPWKSSVRCCFCLIFFFYFSPSVFFKPIFYFILFIFLLNIFQL